MHVMSKEAAERLREVMINNTVQWGSEFLECLDGIYFNSGSDGDDGRDESHRGIRVIPKLLQKNPK